MDAAQKVIQQQEKKLRQDNVADTRQSAELAKELARREKERRELMLQLQERDSLLKAREQEFEEERIRARSREEQAEHRLKEANMHEEKWRALKRENKNLRKRVQHLQEQLEDQALLHQQQIPKLNTVDTTSDSEPEQGNPPSQPPSFLSSTRSDASPAALDSLLSSKSATSEARSSDIDMTAIMLIYLPPFIAGC